MKKEYNTTKAYYYFVYHFVRYIQRKAKEENLKVVEYMRKEYGTSKNAMEFYFFDKIIISVSTVYGDIATAYLEDRNRLDFSFVFGENCITFWVTIGRMAKLKN